MATGFASLLTALEGVDFFTLLLPFLVTYVVILFGVRQIGHLDDSNVPPVVALAGAFFLAFSWPITRRTSHSSPSTGPVSLSV